MGKVENSDGTPGVGTPEVAVSGKKKVKRVSESRKLREAERALDKDEEKAEALLRGAVPAAAMTMIELLNSEDDEIRYKASKNIMDRVAGMPEKISKMRELGKAKPIVLMWQDAALEVKAKPVKELEDGKKRETA
jgi:hypothetical protein